MIAKPYLIAALAAFALSGLSGWKGYSLGENAAEARQAAATAALQRRLFDAADAQSEMAAQLEAERRAAADRAIIAEDGARSDPAAPSRRPSPDSLRRLEARWGSPNPGP